MQQSAYNILHSYGEKLVSPSIPFTVGGATTWLNNFLHAAGGKSFDITGLHLYPSDAAAKAGYNADHCALSRAEVLRSAGKPQAALDVLDKLSGAVEQTE